MKHRTSMRLLAAGLYLLALVHFGLGVALLMAFNFWGFVFCFFGGYTFGGAHDLWKGG